MGEELTRQDLENLTIEELADLKIELEDLENEYKELLNESNED